MHLTAQDKHDLAVIVISTNEAHWIERCLPTVFDHAGGASLDVVVVDNSSTDGTRELVEERFPEARVVTSANHGFGYGNNRGLETTSSRYVLFLNPDTEVVNGTFGDLIRRLDELPEVGLAGVRQTDPDGELHPTIRRFPNAARAFGEALASERWPFHPAWSGERVLDWSVYQREHECDWTAGSFMLARREALVSSGILDERFFIYSEEPDLCLRMKRAGWRVLHMPGMSIIHHAGKGGVRPRMIAQDAYSRRQYALKHFARPHRAAYLGAVATRHLVRSVGWSRDPEMSGNRRAAALLALRTLSGRAEPPFGPPPHTAILAPAVSNGRVIGARPSTHRPPAHEPLMNRSHEYETWPKVEVRKSRSSGERRQWN